MKLILLSIGILVWIINCIVWIWVHPQTYFMSQKEVEPYNYFHIAMAIAAVTMVVGSIILWIMEMM